MVPVYRYIGISPSTTADVVYVERICNAGKLPVMVKSGACVYHTASLVLFRCSHVDFYRVMYSGTA